MKRIYLLAYITILCCLCPLLKAQLGPMPFTPVPPNDPSLVRLLNSDVRCRQWVDSVMQRLTLKERIGQLTPWMLQNLTPAGTFLLFAVMCIPYLLIVWKLIPETTGKSLEEIERYWMKK